jgi:hypothetical protein
VSTTAVKITRRGDLNLSTALSCASERYGNVLQE